MKLLYEAANSLEAHMILNLLEQERLSARIDGEYLQGGIGELPAITVRVMVEEADYPAAKKIIDEWNKKQPDQSTKTPSKKFSYSSAMIGLVIGVIIMSAYYRFPINENGIDHNNDGKLDEIWGFSKTEVDRNFDGNIDYINFLYRNGSVKSSSSDEDFNGTFETTIKYENGNAILWESDTTGIGFNDYSMTYKYGVNDTETFLSVYTNKPVKINKYNGMKIIKTEIDTDNDGIMDTIYEYDSIGEITKKYKK